MKSESKLRRIWAISANACIMFFLYANAYCGPQPPPMEVELDLAEHVVIGRIVELDKEFDPKGGFQRATATIEIGRTLKGRDSKTVNAEVVIGVGAADRVRAWAPHIRQKGDSGIWILGNASETFGLVPESKLKEVEQTLEFLSHRTWTNATDGLAAWAGVMYPQYEPAPQPWIALAIRNVSDHEIYYPLYGVGGTAVAEGGKTLQLQSREERGERVFCRRLLPGQTVYLLNDFFAFLFKDAPPDKYRLMLTYDNSQDGRTSVVPGKQAPVEAWKGKLILRPVEVPPVKYSSDRQGSEE